MAVAEASKMEKDEGGTAAPVTPTWLSGAFGWGPRKFSELKSFFGEVKAELKKVTWPGRQEVYGTTIVVIITTIAFGFYLFGADLVFSRALSLILK